MRRHLKIVYNYISHKCGSGIIFKEQGSDFINIPVDNSGIECVPRSNVLRSSPQKHREHIEKQMK